MIDTDYSEFADFQRVQRWREAPDLAHEALGHAVGLRDHLYGDGDPSEAKDRARILVDLLGELNGSPSSP
jgi:hypothetical protein